MKKFDLKKMIAENKATFFSSLNENQETLDQVRDELLGLFQPYGDFDILDMNGSL